MTPAIRRLIGWGMLSVSGFFLVAFGGDLITDGRLSASLLLRTAAMTPDGRVMLRALGLADLIGALALANARLGRPAGLLNMSPTLTAVLQCGLVPVWIRAYPAYPPWVPLIAAALLLVGQSMLPRLESPAGRRIPLGHWPLAALGLARVFWPS